MDMDVGRGKECTGEWEQEGEMEPLYERTREKRRAIR